MLKLLGESMLVSKMMLKPYKEQFRFHVLVTFQIV